MAILQFIFLTLLFIAAVVGATMFLAHKTARDDERRRDIYEQHLHVERRMRAESSTPATVQRMQKVVGETTRTSEKPLRVARSSRSYSER